MEQLDYVRVEGEARERIAFVGACGLDVRDHRQDTLHEARPTASALIRHARIEKVTRFFCHSAAHTTESCKCNIRLHKKKNHLAKAGRRFKCTIKGHRSIDCHRRVICYKCDTIRSLAHATSACITRRTT